MSKLLQLRGGTTSEHSSFTGALREVTVDTTKDTLVVHDGSTAAGFALARESALTTTTALANAALPKSGGALTGALTTNSTIDGVDIATRDGILTSTTSTANAALPKSGGALTGAVTTNSTIDGRDVAADGVLATNAMPKSGGAFTGAVTTNSTIDGRDVAADGVLATNALPKAGGTMTGNVSHGDNVKAKFGAGDDLQIYHDGSDSWITDSGTGNLWIGAENNLYLADVAGNDVYIQCVKDGAVSLRYDNAAKLATTSAGVSVTGSITVSGTVDGRDVATDGTKLDGIAASATNVTNNNQITNGAGYTTNVGDITGVTAGTGMSGGGTSGTVTLTCTIDSPSEVGLGNLSSSGNALSGNFTATGNVTAYSDERLKSHIQTIPHALDKVLSVRGVTFDMNGERATGVIAQELEKVLPEAVFDNTDGFKSVAYGNVVGLLIEAIKEQQTQIETLMDMVGE